MPAANLTYIQNTIFGLMVLEIIACIQLLIIIGITIVQIFFHLVFMKLFSFRLYPCFPFPDIIIVFLCFVFRLEVALLLIVYLAYGYNEGGALSYILLSISSWFMALSWLFAPYLFNPSGFEWQK